MQVQPQHHKSDKRKKRIKNAHKGKLGPSAQGQQWTHSTEVLPRFDLTDVDHTDPDALGKAEHKMGNPCYLCRKFGHLSRVHFPTSHKWCQADTDRWHATREHWHCILADLRLKQFSKYQIAERRSVDVSTWPPMSDREFLAAVMEAATGLSRWDDGTDPRSTSPRPIKDAPAAEFFQNMLVPGPARSLGSANQQQLALPAPPDPAFALPAPPSTQASHLGFPFQADSPVRKRRGVKDKRNKRERTGDLVTEALGASPQAFAQIALDPKASALQLPSYKPSSTPSSLSTAVVGLPAHALNMRVQDAENSLKTLTEDRKHVWQQLGRIDRSVSDLKRSGNVSHSLMGQLLVKVGGVSQNEVQQMMQDARDAALAELPPSLDPQIEERLRLASIEDGPAVPTIENLQSTASGSDTNVTPGRLSVASTDSFLSATGSTDLMDVTVGPGSSTANTTVPQRKDALGSWTLGWKPAQEWKMVDMAALMECRGALSSTPAIRRRNEGVHALSHMGEGLFMVALAPTPSADATSSPTARTYQVVKVRSVGQRPAGHLVLGLSNQVQLQNALEPAVESTEPCGFDTWELNVFDKIFF